MKRTDINLADWFASPDLKRLFGGEDSAPIAARPAPKPIAPNAREKELA